MICPQNRGERQKLVKKLELTYPVLGDHKNEVAASYGLRHGFPDDLKQVYQGFGLDLEKDNGDWTLPLPARYVIDSDGKVLKLDVNADYTIRPDPSETIAFLESLQA